MERKALYNSLRLDWKKNKEIKVEPWQVEDLRVLAITDLLKKMQSLGLAINRQQFIALAEEIETPEEMTELLLTHSDLDQQKEDQLFLVIFELWRRLIPEKQSFTILCDEIDYQVENYMDDNLGGALAIEDLLANLQMLLDENRERGANPQALFETITQGCAHDFESFLYEYIATQLELQNHDYAKDLVESFLPYVSDHKWFELLEAKVLAHEDLSSSHQLMQSLIKHAQKEDDLGFHLEMLSYLAQKGEERSFLQLAKMVLPQLESEEDFQDFLESCEEFFHFKDAESSEQFLGDILRSRRTLPLNQPISTSDPDLRRLKELLVSVG